ncbi:MAG: hypothetical protein QOJ51_3999 [Acidobacteriaceae bacterium]|jgi:hypothetical protein|nr:hypothetical protein [Acidobacteriaceae bacterium]MDX6456919.1 hypothetical protein [Acidobacteriaceae bacterium]MEA2261174.1 hypothetical protein [Acidobacteriaceae bacterium]
MADAPAPTEIERGFQSMYNLQFDQAHQNFSAWERLHPNDPLGPVSQAAGYLFGEFARLGILESELFTNDKTFEDRAKLAPDPKVRDEFNGAVSRGDRLADAALKQNPEDTNALFAKILALGLRSDYVALIDKQDFAALHYMKQGRILAQQLLKEKPDEYDAMLAVGVENYLTGIKPAPIRWMLSLGGIDPNKEQGLRELEQTAAHGNLLKPFAKLLLAVAALRDKNNTHGCDLLHQLAVAYPRNALYRNGAPECR